MPTIIDVAQDLGKSNNKEVLEKAKELGFKATAVNSKISDEEAAILYDYVMTGIIPEVIRKKLEKKSKKSTKEKQEDSIKETLEDSNKQTPKETKKDSKKTTKKKDENIESKEVNDNKDSIESTQKAQQKREFKIISRGDEDKKPLVSKKKDSIKETPKETTKETPKDSIKDEPKKVEVIESIEVIDEPKGFEPKGFDPTLAKIQKTKFSGFRVISKNEPPKIESKEPKSSSDKKQDSKKILDNLKNTESKEKKSKKKDKPKQNKPHHHAHIIEMEREISFSDYDDEQDEIMLMDAFEIPSENYEDERAKKAELNDKIKVNRYSPWMKEGSIARPSKGKGKKGKNRSSKESGEAVKSLILPEEIRVYEFAEKANLELGNVLGKLFMLGVKMLKNDFLDKDTIEILASEYNIEVSIQSNATFEQQEEEIIESDLLPRPPVVTIMGHVDHGKTSLLDYIRNSRVASGEAGGITQHIGAYMVEKNGKWISFIDTPGHEAFAQMRSRGAQVTDIAIIVIAADDGVKQQSIEALNHAKSANVQIIIAMNKMDKEGANPDKLKAECAELGFTPMDWGGSYEFIPISAKTGMGVDVLLETILLQAEILDLKASQKATPKAVVLEGSKQVGKGSVATIIVRQGILEIGQSIVADTAYGKVRSLKDDTGKDIESLKPSWVAQITGLSEVPLAGATLQVVENDAIAREIASKRAAYLRQKQLSKSTKVTFDELSSMVAKGQIKMLPVILRADTQGSLEAIKSSLESLNNQEVQINVISYGVGGITQSDIDLANASTNCIVLGFNVRPTSDIKALAKDFGISIKTYSVIYDLIDDMKALLSGLMSPILEEEVVGIASVREIFNVAKLGVIAGCMVIDGKVERNLNVRVLRNGVVIWSGKIASLKRFKDDVKEVAKGFECGIMLDNFNDITPGDELEIYKEIEKQRVL